MVLGLVLVLFLVSLPRPSVSSTRHDDKNSLYPPNSLTQPGALYRFNGEGFLPAPRVHHSLTHLEPYIIVYGGASSEGDFLDDIHMYDLRSQSWTGEIERKECCNREGDVVETLGSISGLPLPGKDEVHELPIGFQGGVPAGRAEHGVASSNGLMYMFGGASELGLLQDFFSFDPAALKWTSLSRRHQSWPTRRAGHSLEATSTNLVMFGGRVALSNGMTKSLNDVWMYKLDEGSWAKCPSQNGLEPAGRVHAGSTLYDNELWIFGGMDSSSHLTYNDMWSFNLDSFEWKQHFSTSGADKGFLPPPLHHVHLIPSRDHGILVYGGIGNGGSCGGENCGASSTVFGQLYRFDITASSWVPSRLYSNSHRLASDYVEGGEWEFGRLSSDHSEDSGGTAKLTKETFLEKIAISTERNVIFEFGGVGYNSSLDSPLENNGGSSDEIWPTMYQSRVGQGDIFHDAGGVLSNSPWDLYTGEQLRENVDLPYLNRWFYNNLPTGVNSSQVKFQNIFRQFTVAKSDVVLLSRVKSSGPSEPYSPPAFKFSDFTESFA